MNQIFKRNQWLKKSAAVCMAALLGVTAAPVSAFAEETYSDVEKAAMTEAVTKFAADYANSLVQYNAMKSGIHEDMILTVDDAGRSLLGFAVPADISWLKELKLSADVSVGEGTQFMNAGFYLNDTKLCTIEYYFDLANMLIYMKVPELRDGYIKVDYAQAMAAAEEEIPEEAPSDFDTAAFMKGYMTVLGNIPAFMPETTVMEDLLNRYGSILFDHTSEEFAGEEALTLGQITENCTVYEGRLSPSAAIATMQDVLDTAKTDEQLKNLLNSWDENLPETENLYQTFLEVLDNAATSIHASELSADDSYLSSKIWVDEEGEITGRLISLYENNETTTLVNWQNVTNDEDYESLLQIGPDDESIALAGKGKITNDILNGTYNLFVESAPVVDIELSNYDTKAAENGNFNGNYKFTPIISDTEDPAYNIMKNFAFLMDIASDGTSGNIDLALTSAGSTLGRLSIAAAMGTPVEKPDAPDLTEVYDSMDEAAMNEYIANASFETLLQNLITAGVPEDLITAVLSGDSASENQ